MHNPQCAADEVFFPDEVVVEVISRLPAKTALRCRCVCKRWRDLTWSRHFLDLYLRRGAPMFLIQTSASKLFLFDYWWNTAIQTIHEFCINTPSNIDEAFYHPHSNDGIIAVREHSRSFIVLNPIYGNHEYVRISLAWELTGWDIIEVFFHPSLKEYCTLWQIPDESDCKILNLGPNPCWRTIRYPCNGEANMSPIIYLDGFIYWNGPFEIAEFDLQTELFTPIPLPETVKCQNMEMKKIYNNLSLIKVSSTEKIVHVNVWTLHDRVEKSWKNSSYNISLEVSIPPEDKILAAIAFWDGELFLKVIRNRFVCNLKTGTATRTTVFTNAKEEKENRFFFCCPHTMSLDSLRNCKSKIFIYKEGLKPWWDVEDSSLRYRYFQCSDDSGSDYSDDEGNIPDTRISSGLIQHLHYF